MSQEKSIEQKIQDKGLNAPRLSPDKIKAVIHSEHYFTADQGVYGAYKRNHDVFVGDRPSDKNVIPLQLLTICVLVLNNGFTVTGESACVSPENFDAEIGREVAKNKAVEKIWALEGYLLKQNLLTAQHNTA